MSLANAPLPVVQHWIPAPSKRRRGLAMAPVRFLVAHDTGNPGSTAINNARYYARTANEQSASAHLFVDDRQIVECVPSLTAQQPEKAWHVLYGVATDNQLYGCDANDAAIGVEYCYGKDIEADKAYAGYVWLLAHLCHRFQLSPDRDVVGHFMLDPQRKTDPVTGLAHSRRTYEQLLRDVGTQHARLSGTAPEDAPPTEKPALGRYRSLVRLNLRAGSPTRTSPIAQTIAPGTLLDMVAETAAGEAVNGISRWFKTAAGYWCWGGGVEPVPA